MSQTLTLSRNDFDPIADVDLDTYASVIADQLCGDATDIAIDAHLASVGISPERWVQARAGWTRRIRENADVRAAYARRYRSSITGAGY
jgi:hypothetical protein